MNRPQSPKKMAWETPTLIKLDNFDNTHAGSIAGSTEGATTLRYVYHYYNVSSTVFTTYLIQGPTS